MKKLIAETKLTESELSAGQCKRIKRLIRNECCNYRDDNNCIVIDDGGGTSCPQYVSKHLCCAWFKEAVLPLNKLLHSELIYVEKSYSKKCKLCGEEICCASNARKYCVKCAKKMERRRKADYMRRKRGQM